MTEGLKRGVLTVYSDLVSLDSALWCLFFASPFFPHVFLSFLLSVLSSRPASCHPLYLQLKSIPMRRAGTLVENLSPALHAQSKTHMGNK